MGPNGLVKPSTIKGLMTRFLLNGKDVFEQEPWVGLGFVLMYLNIYCIMILEMMI